MTGWDESFDPPFTVVEPAALTAPVLFNSPHSGSIYPHDFLAMTRLAPSALRRSEDTFVDELFAGVVAQGYPLMRANFPRCFVDVNREPYELDPRMFAGRLPSYANTRSMRVAGGLGTIARVVGESREIYTRRLTVEEALQRIDVLYKPYHRTLRRLLSHLQRDFGAALLVDCHSMPSSSGHRDDRGRPDIVLGDRYGTSCMPQVTDLIEETLRGLGYSVARNKPYAGGFITEHYGNPSGGLHAVQIELNRALYMDETTLERGPSFQRVATDMTTLARALADIPMPDLKPYRVAAE